MDDEKFLETLERDVAELKAMMHPATEFLDRLEKQLIERKKGINPFYSGRIALAALIILLAVAVVSIHPVLRAAAQELWDFFQTGGSNARTVMVSHRETHETMLQVGPVENAPFEVRYPSFTPPNYVLAESTYHPIGRMINLRYECSAGEWGFFITQRQISESQLAIEMDAVQQMVGASATVERIPLRNVTVEYVKGGWKPVAQPDFTGVPPEGEVPLQEIWDETLDFHQVTWYEDGYLFRVYTSRGSIAEPNNGACRMDREDFIQVAVTMP